MTVKGKIVLSQQHLIWESALLAICFSSALPIPVAIFLQTFLKSFPVTVMRNFS